MSIIGPLTYEDRSQPVAPGAVYPLQSGVFYITDRATYQRSADALSAYVVTPDPIQHEMGGIETVTLRFDNTTVADAVVTPLNALPPVPTPSPPAAPAPVSRVVSKYDYRQRFTAEEQAREVIFRQSVMEKTAAELSDPANLLYVEARIAYAASEEVANYNLDDPNIAAFTNMLAQAGVIDPGRVAAILG